MMRAPCVLLAAGLLGAVAAEVCDETSRSAEPSGPADLSLLQHALKLEGETAGGLVRGDPATHSLFMKFHKVAGTTWSQYVLLFTGEDEACSSICGNKQWVCHQDWPEGSQEYLDCGRHGVFDLVESKCDTTPRSCTWHQSLGVMRQAQTQHVLAANASDLTAAENLWPDPQRFELLWGVDWARAFLPSPPSFLSKRLVTTTVLREPAERIRSYYYFHNTNATRAGFLRFLEYRRDFVAGNSTQEQFDRQASLYELDRGAPTLSILLRSCCEYETWLGDGCPEKAKATLSTQFNLVGITERMNEGLVSLGKLYGFTPEEVAEVGRSIPHKLENDDKLDWTDEELALARFVAKKSKVVYDFAQELFDNQAVKLWGSKENLLAAVDTFEKLDPNN